MCAVSARVVARGRRHRGVTLPGVLVGLSLSALVLALLGSSMVTLLRQAHRQHDRTQARAQLAHAAGVLTAELRTVTAAPSATDVGDLLLTADTAVELRAAVGGGAACAVTSDAVELVDATGPGAPFVAWWSDGPQPDDMLHLHDEGPTPMVADDAWLARAVVDVERGGSACAAGPLAPWAAAAVRLRLAGPPLPPTLGAGAPVRVTRRRRYVLYRAGDGRWHLGQRAWIAGVGTLQPVAGPLNAAAATHPGLGVLALAVDGTPAAGASSAVRIAVVVRAERAWAGRRWLDSSLVHVPLDAGRAP